MDALVGVHLDDELIPEFRASTRRRAVPDTNRERPDVADLHRRERLPVIAAVCPYHRPVPALVLAFFAVQAGYHGFTAALPVALVKAGLPDPEIGLIVGIASVVQVPAAFLAGGLIDRFGGPRVLLFGSLASLAGAVLLALPFAEAGTGGAIPFFVLARVLQGIGVATTTPAAFAIVPGLIDRARVGVGLAQA